MKSTEEKVLRWVYEQAGATGKVVEVNALTDRRLMDGVDVSDAVDALLAGGFVTRVALGRVVSVTPKGSAVASKLPPSGWP